MLQAGTSFVQVKNGLKTHFCLLSKIRILTKYDIVAHTARRLYAPLGTSLSLGEHIRVTQKFVDIFTGKYRNTDNTEYNKKEDSTSYGDDESVQAFVDSTLRQKEKQQKLDIEPAVLQQLVQDLKVKKIIGTR